MYRASSASPEWPRTFASLAAISPLTIISNSLDEPAPLEAKRLSRLVCRWCRLLTGPGRSSDKSKLKQSELPLRFRNRLFSVRNCASLTIAILTIIFDAPGPPLLSCDSKTWGLQTLLTNLLSLCNEMVGLWKSLRIWTTMFRRCLRVLILSVVFSVGLPGGRLQLIRQVRHFGICDSAVVVRRQALRDACLYLA